MLFPQDLLANAERLFEVRPRCRVVPLVLEQRTQVIEGLRRSGVLCPQNFRLNAERLFVVIQLANLVQNFLDY